MHVILKTMKKRCGQSPESHDECIRRTGHFSSLHFHSSLQGFSYLLRLFPAFLVFQKSIVDLSLLPAKPCQLNSFSNTLSSFYLRFSLFLEFTGKNFYSRATSACIHMNNFLVKQGNLCKC